MSVKKICSDYQSEKLSDLPWLQKELDELISYTEDYYNAKRDKHNKQLRDEYDKKQKEKWDKWNSMKENLSKYSEKYYGIVLSHLFKPREIERLVFDQYVAHKIFEFPGQESFHTETNPIKRNALLDPKNIKMPDEPQADLEPIPMTDLKPFKEVVRKRIQAIEQQIEQIKDETSTTMSQSAYEPLPLSDDHWLYQNIVYEVVGGHSDEEKKLLILEFTVKDRRKFERLKNKFSGKKSDEVKYERTRIPEEVRIAVWRRDQGRCARCGNRENLEYDHIVPVSKGGGNTERNIELLCQDCNRAKGNRIE